MAGRSRAGLDPGERLCGPQDHPRSQSGPIPPEPRGVGAGRVRTLIEHPLLQSPRKCYASRVICPAYLGRSMIRSVNGGGANDRLPWDATKPRAVRKVEARSPARRSAESCHQPGRRVARSGSKATGWLRRASFDRVRTGTPRAWFSGAAWESSYVLTLWVPPKSRRVEQGTRSAPEATNLGHLQAIRSSSGAVLNLQKPRAPLAKSSRQKFCALAVAAPQPQSEAA